MSSRDSTSHTKKPANTAFKQQRLKAWQPILTPKPVILSFLILGIIFIPIGIGVVYSSNSVVQVDQRYDNICNVGTICNITIDIPTLIHPPVYLYYRLENYYQNHRRYVNSRSDDQLRGLTQTYKDLSDCSPWISEGEVSDPDKIYFPCGLIAKSLFNDTFSLWKDESPIPLKKDGIAWPSDRDKKFRNPPPNTKGIRVIPDIEDEDFIVWMRTAGLPDFKKLYRIIEEPLQGTYVVKVNANYPVHSFSGKKHIVFSTTTWIGGKNPFLGYAYIVVGAICFVQGVIFGIKHKVAPRKLGDTKYLEWNK